MRLHVFVFAFAATAATDAPAEMHGAELFETCAGCHQIGEGAEAGTGPALNEVVGRPAGATDFVYSDALQDAAGEGLVWTRDTLDAFLASPTEFLPGTSMVIDGIESPSARSDLIDFLETHTGATEGFAVAPEILALEGDMAYGEYLSGECTACHRAGGTDIPSITGWDAPRFVTALHAYRAGARMHPVMQMVASRLDDDQIAALAAYFATQE